MGYSLDLPCQYPHLDEFAFRYNGRKMSDGDRAAMIVIGAEGKRLTYRQPSNSPDESAAA